MTNLTAWAGSTGSIAYQSAFGAELNVAGGIATGMSILSSVVFDNTTGAGQFLDVSFVGALTTASAVIAGSAIGFSLAVLQRDGVTFGDGRLTAGAAPVTYQPILDPLMAIPVVPGTITNIIGDIGLGVLRPVKFSLILTNNLGFTLAATGNSCSISQYRQNLNA